MNFQVTVQPSGRQFTCDDSETILSAAIRAGVGLPYGCKNGACSSLAKAKSLLATSPIANIKKKLCPLARKNQIFRYFAALHCIPTSPLKPAKSLVSVNFQSAKCQAGSLALKKLPRMLPTLATIAGYGALSVSGQANVAVIAWRMHHITTPNSRCTSDICPVDYLPTRYFSP